MDILNKFISFITGVAFWLFTLGAIIFGTLMYQYASYATYYDCVRHIDKINTPEYKYTYKNNIFYIIYEYLNPDDFEDVKYLEQEDYIKTHKNELNRYNLLPKS